MGLLGELDLVFEEKKLCPYLCQELFVEGMSGQISYIFHILMASIRIALQ
jgi:hypothetical protein